MRNRFGICFFLFQIILLITYMPYQGLSEETGFAQKLQFIKTSGYKLLYPSVDNLYKIHNNSKKYRSILKNNGFRDFDALKNPCDHWVYKYKEEFPKRSKKYSYNEVYPTGNTFQAILRCPNLTSISWRADTDSLFNLVARDLGNHDRMRSESWAYAKYYNYKFNNITYEVRLLKSHHQEMYSLDLVLKN